MEYLLVLMDRYISYEKPKMLAKLYLAYLEAVIVWEEMTMYSEVIDRMLLLDYNTLISNSGEFIVHRNIGGEAILRLVALGLMTDTTNVSPFKEHGNGSIIAGRLSKKIKFYMPIIRLDMKITTSFLKKQILV